MKRAPYAYLVLVIVFALFGGLSAYFAAMQPLESEFTKVFSSDGSPIQHASIRHSSWSVVLSIVSALFFSLAVSVFISVFVSRRIEGSLVEEKRSELERMREAINADVFNSLFKKLVPAEIFDVIRADVIGNKVIRRNAIWMYDFEVLEDGDIELKQTIKHELHNLSRDAVTDAINATFDDHQEARVCSLYCRLEGHELIAFDFPLDAFEGLKVGEEREIRERTIRIARKDSNQYEVKATVTIPPGRHIDVTQVYKTRYRGGFINDSYFTKYPLIDARLIVHFPAGYTLSIFPSLSSPLNLTLSEERRVIYELKGGVLPRQGFVYTLKPLPRQESQCQEKVTELGPSS